MTLTYNLLDPGDFEGEGIPDDELDRALLLELATISLAGISLEEPEVLQFVADMGYPESGPWLKRHGPTIAGICTAMTDGGAREFDRLVAAGLYPLDSPVEPESYIVDVKVHLLATGPKVAAAMVAGHIQHRLPVQFTLVEVEPGERSSAEAGVLPGP